MISLASIGSTIANNRAVQWGIGVGIVVIGFLVWLARHNEGIRMTERMRIEHKARQTQDKIRKDQDVKSMETDHARAHAPLVDSASELPEHIARVLIRD